MGRLGYITVPTLVPPVLSGNGEDVIPAIGEKPLAEPVTGIEGGVPERQRRAGPASRENYTPRQYLLESRIIACDRLSSGIELPDDHLLPGLHLAPLELSLVAQHS